MYGRWPNWIPIWLRNSHWWDPRLTYISEKVKYISVTHRLPTYLIQYHLLPHLLFLFLIWLGWFTFVSNIALASFFAIKITCNFTITSTYDSTCDSYFSFTCYLSSNFNFSIDSTCDHLSGLYYSFTIGFVITKIITTTYTYFTPVLVIMFFTTNVTYYYSCDSDLWVLTILNNFF